MGQELRRHNKLSRTPEEHHIDFYDILVIFIHIPLMIITLAVLKLRALLRP